eukprot:TRINITY_DN35520_c0_g1_i1.p1 TRINITY_DN35520_c0_g1~~TRINITY_DN35520_c0_g1_i1.p1  ORF type:complete len:223 (-),score=45.28 TRINITY_DN35520_c0_g1_i1:89-718(-)
MAQPDYFEKFGAGLQDGHLSSEERWRFVWACISIYYSFDATCGLVVATLGFLGGLVIKHFLPPSECPSMLGTLSAAVLALRVVETSCGWFGLLRNPFPRRSEMLGSILRNMVVCLLQLGLGIAIICIAASLLLTNIHACIFTAVFSVVGAVLLIMQAAHDAVVWPLVLALWFLARYAPVPNWVDHAIPACIKNRILKKRSGADARLLEQ